MTRPTHWLADARITAWVSLTTLVYFAAEWVVSATWRGNYGYRSDAIGSLGVAFCGPAGDWPCSSLYPVMNVSLVITGVAVALVAAGFLVQRVTDRAHSILLFAAGLCLAASGVLTYQVDYSWNLTAIVAFMTLGSVSVLLIAISSTSQMSGERRACAIVAGVVSLIGFLAFMGGHTFFGAGGAERMAVYGVLVAVIALGTAGLRRTSVAGEHATRRELAEQTS